MWDQFKSTLEDCLCPPGNGVFTVNTGKERKTKLHQALYGTTENVDALWKDKLNELPAAGKAIVLGVCSDTGGGILRGANWGPLFLRNTLLDLHPDVKAFDIGDIRVIPHLLHDKYMNEATITNCRKALYKDKNAKYSVAPLSITQDIATEFYKNFPDKGLFGIGGDHSCSYPLTKAWLLAKKEQGKKAAIIHFDAHTDLLVERLGIDLCFGSWCTHILEDLPKPNHLIQIGIRSTGKPKEHWQDTFGVVQHWTCDVKKQGAEAIVAGIVAQLKADKVDELYISFDIDAIDSEYVAATGTPEPDGMSPEEALIIIETLANKFPITGADMMEIAPFLNTSQQHSDEPQTTLKIGADISAMLIKAMQR
ncbi:MAG: arginase family protein [Algicola sp.]|nr:arginase family protein [Algicola sp.]